MKKDSHSLKTSPSLSALEAKPIKRAVFSGGGSKAVTNAGVYRALEETGVLADISELSGSSAGAITSAFIAVGTPTRQLRDIMLSTNFIDLLGKSVKKQAPGVSFLTKDGKPLEHFLRKHLVNTVRTFLEQLDHSDQLAKDHKDFAELLKKFKRKYPSFTFKDLAILNRLFPHQFKQLIVTAVKFPNGEIQIFNSQETPDVEIALAVRASSSLPVILEPVEISLSEGKHTFVDGGLYDNLPTDYFDMENGVFQKNKKPDQTLVFAFGEGKTNEENSVFQALYGERHDEAIHDAVVENIITMSVKLAKKWRQEKFGPKKSTPLMMKAVRQIVRQEVHQQHLTHLQESIFIKAIQKTLDELFFEPQTHEKFVKAFHQEKDKATQVKLLAKLIGDKLKPILFQAGFFERFKRTYVIESLGGLTTPYSNLECKEIGYHKLRTEYPLRTIELRTGTINATDFKLANRLARVMDALGYLDTINHLTNHELDDESKFDAKQFYVDIVHQFEHIYHGVLHASSRDPMKDPLLINLAKLKEELQNLGKSEAIISRQLYQLIKDSVEKDLESFATFALSRAVEFHNDTISAEDLFKEVYEVGYKSAGWFSISKIIGKPIYQSNQLHEVLKDKSMFALFAHMPVHANKTRSDNIFEALVSMKKFREAYEATLIPKTKSHLMEMISVLTDSDAEKEAFLSPVKRPDGRYVTSEGNLDGFIDLRIFRETQLKRFLRGLATNVPLLSLFFNWFFVNVLGMKLAYFDQQEDQHPEKMYQLDDEHHITEGEPDQFTIHNLGHATQLIQTSGMNIITDPVFDNLAPVVYPSMTKPFGFDAQVKDLPQIDVILISHNHRDHVSEEFLTQLLEKIQKNKQPEPQVLVPEGDEAFFRSLGFSNVRPFEWHDQMTFSSKTNEQVTFVNVPADHRSGRKGFDSHQSLVTGWSISPKNRKEILYFAGDTTKLSDVRMKSLALDIYDLVTNKNDGVLSTTSLPKIINMEPGGPNYTRKDMNPTHQSAVESIVSAFRLAKALELISEKDQNQAHKITAAHWLEATATIFMHHNRYELGPDRLNESVFIFNRLLSYLKMDDETLAIHEKKQQTKSEYWTLFHRRKDFIIDGVRELKRLAQTIWPDETQDAQTTHLIQFIEARTHFPLIKQKLRSSDVFQFALGETSTIVPDTFDANKGKRKGEKSAPPIPKQI